MNPRRGFRTLAHRKATSLRGAATVGTLAKNDLHPRSRVLVSPREQKPRAYVNFIFQIQVIHFRLKPPQF